MRRQRRVAARTRWAAPKRRTRVATVRATCPACGDVDLKPTGVQVEICVTTGVATYSFLCLGCRLMVNRPADDQVVEALSQVGVKIVRWELPAELSEPKFGPAITHDDLLSFHLALRDENWQEQLAGIRWRS